ncbi:coronin [Culex quinquefasciatus]|uniref:Coronin n=1 Tax=Culex quinquefasciatus TaxID=7176 RepID=B0X9K5_CULQU|nr:coronin [Culex quinquefasciatus]|eukprot:XP_001866327.1 coronin [Culex quinquefasciatus]
MTGFDKYVSEIPQDLPFKSQNGRYFPATLIPFYDEDSSTVFATCKGDSTIYCYEVTEESPFICPLLHHKCSSLIQGLSFVPNNTCDVASVEFDKAQFLPTLTNANRLPSPD